MATIDLATGLGAGTHPTRFGNTKVPYLVEVEIDFAAAATAKGSALAAADVIQAVDVPEGSVVLVAGAQVTEAMTGTAADATVDVAIGASTFVDGFDLDAAAVGAYAPAAAAASAVAGADDTIDVTLATATGTVTGGKLRVFALVVDVAELSRPGLAQLGS